MLSLQSCPSNRVIDKKAILNNNSTFPIICFGTFRICGRDTIYNVLDTAFNVGYRAIDTAAVYGNEEDIGIALKTLLPKYKLKRQDIFITSKLAPHDHGDENKVRNAVYGSLKKLNTPYLDVYLIHWPAAGGLSPANPINATIRANTWKILEELYDNGKGILKSIGVSNYTAQHITEIIQSGATIPAINQIEFHPHWQQTEELHSICSKHRILLQAYSSLGGTSNKSLLKDPTVLHVATRNNISAAKVLLRWALQRNYAVVPKSITPEKIKENADLDKPLSDADMNLLNNIGRKEKYAWNPDIVL